ncbi:MAG: hypothetical protein QXX84_04405 [Sulfolobales archaeon]
MTIYWQRCDWCGVYNIVKPCYLHPLDSICYASCITCKERAICPNPAWSPWAKPLTPPSPRAPSVSSSLQPGGSPSKHTVRRSKGKG